MLTGDDHRSLIWLQTNWGGYYMISLADGVWRAVRISNPAVVLTADSARQLRDLLRDDHAEVASRQRHPRGPAEGGSL
jgi:hypothetical protein